MTQEYAQQQRIVGGRYAIIREIGRGGMGVVWLAEDRTIGRRVAIKELHLPDGIAPQERYVYEERVLREARTAGRLSDPAIVTVFDVVQESGNTFIVMELIEAPTLADIVRQRGPVSEAFTARVAEQLVSALDTAHRAGIVHRDVKPSNVMVDANGRVKLTDFGIAQSTEDPRLTTSGTLIGSPTYMSPERLKGQEAVPASDLWALGATLFYAVEGYGPYDRQNTAASIQAIMNEVAFLTRCRGPLASLIMGLLNSEPAGRPTAPQVRALLGQATQAIPNTGPTSPAMWTPNPTTQPGGPAKSRKPPRLVLAAVAGVVLLAAGWFGHVLLSGTTTDTPTNAQTSMTYGEGGAIPVFEPYFSARQSCLAKAPADQSQYKNADQIDCLTKPHTTELYGEVKVDFKQPNKSQNKPGAGYPGEFLRKFGEAGCALIFNSDKIGPDKQKMTFIALIPTTQAWSDPDGAARTIPCLATTKDKSTVTGSIVVKDDS
ncbi:serine/threonine-protein kinase [Actinocrispum wychmicini]|uniref:non-specific serine/threonine protein kinase n=1 Tax=Actinocrispum wychmicini TaxID=1213861 RepID=A0A4R2JCS9_9PSEU|nr:serine/threonine-protein kinase [Actinocrispum wychmicini]TCO56714.1 serine/threonine protein kinase [Actinocrispum wychmicini]